MAETRESDGICCSLVPSPYSHLAILYLPKLPIHGTLNFHRKHPHLVRRLAGAKQRGKDSYKLVEDV